MELILEVAGKIIGIALIFVLTWAWKHVRDYLQNAVIRDIVADGILFAQRVYGHLSGPERYDKALEQISNELAARGIEISKERLKLFIESILTLLQNQFGPEWWLLHEKTVELKELP